MNYEARVSEVYDLFRDRLKEFSDRDEEFIKSQIRLALAIYSRYGWAVIYLAAHNIVVSDDFNIGIESASEGRKPTPPGGNQSNLALTSVSTDGSVRASFTKSGYSGDMDKYTTTEYGRLFLSLVAKDPQHTVSAFVF